MRYVDCYVDQDTRYVDCYVDQDTLYRMCAAGDSATLHSVSWQQPTSLCITTTRSFQHVRKEGSNHPLNLCDRVGGGRQRDSMRGRDRDVMRWRHVMRSDAMETSHKTSHKTSHEREQVNLRDTKPHKHTMGECPRLKVRDNYRTGKETYTTGQDNKTTVQALRHVKQKKYITTQSSYGADVGNLGLGCIRMNWAQQ